MNPKMMQKAMKKMGVKQKSIDAEEVIIKTKDGNLVIKNPEVMQINMMGQETLQVSGKIERLEEEMIKREDVKLVMEQAKCSEEKAKEALEKANGDIAQAILEVEF